MDEAFLLFSAEAGGCYRCSPWYNMRVDIHRKIEDVVNVFHDMMEKKIENDYPIRLLLIDMYDGEILEDLQLEIEAGCLSGLKEVNFTYNKLNYHIKRGARKKEENEKVV